MSHKFTIIDEKPKRGHAPQPRRPSLAWIVIMGILVTTFFVAVGTIVLILSIRQSPDELELTATILIAVNQTTIVQLTQTNAAIEANNARTPAPQRTLWAI